MSLNIKDLAKESSQKIQSRLELVFYKSSDFFISL